MLVQRSRVVMGGTGVVTSTVGYVQYVASYGKICVGVVSERVWPLRLVGFYVLYAVYTL